LIINNECVECIDDNKILGEYQIKEKMMIVARVTQTTPTSAALSSSLSANLSGANAAKMNDSSANSSSDDGDGSSSSDEAHSVINSPNLEFELMLPSVVSLFLKKIQ
jgi:hypothetical protein